MATITIKGVTFVNTPTQVQSLTVKYRLTGDADIPASYTVVGTNISAGVNGDISPDIVLSGLLVNTSYTIVIVNNCNGRSVSKVVITQDLTTYIWVEDTYICEKDTLISKLLVATGFSSPIKIAYDETSKKMYCVDADSGSGNVFSFDPATFTGIGSVTFSNAVTGHQIYDGAVDFDPVRRRIYMAGLATSGLIVYDMATDSTVGVSGQLAYGNNVGFDRLFVKQIGDFIYGSSRTANTLCIINANTLLKISNNPISAIPSGSLALVDAYNITEVNGQRWVTAGSGRGSRDIYIYNTTFTSLIATIGLTSSTLVTDWGHNLYWGASFFDIQKNKFYYADIGSGNVYIIDGTTRAILKTINFHLNNEGKTSSQIDFSFDPNTGRLYFNYTGFLTTTEPALNQKRRSYIFNRDTLEIDSLYPGLITSALVPQKGSPLLWSVNRGLAIWDGGSWSTDGVITKLSY